MPRRLLILTVAVVALAFAVVSSAASADTFYKCPKSATVLAYCKKVIICVVPNLQGDTPKQAKAALEAHDCRLGKTIKVKSNSGTTGDVLYSSPPKGSYRNAGTKVDIFVKAKPKHHHK